MRMELIQPFINAADAVLADSLQCSTSIGNLSMEEEGYRRHGVAALIALSGDIEGRIIFDADPQTAMRVASRMAGEELPSSEQLMRETVCELANQVIGNAITALKDRKSTRLNSSHLGISYAVFCLKKKKKNNK